MGHRSADSDDTRLSQQAYWRVATEAGAAPLPDEGELRVALDENLAPRCQSDGLAPDQRAVSGLRSHATGHPS